MSINNFKRYMEEEETRIGEAPNKIGASVESTTNFFAFAGNLIEVFLPKVLEVFVAMTGGNPHGNDKSNKRRTPDNGYTGPRNSPK